MSNAPGELLDYDKPRMKNKQPSSPQLHKNNPDSGPPEPIRVLLADGRPRVRAALRLLLEQHPEFRLVGEVAEAGSLLAQTAALWTHLLLLDWNLPGFRADLLPALQSRQPHLKIVAMSTRPEVRSLALAAGVDAFVSKVESPEHLLACLARLRQIIESKNEPGARDSNLAG